MLSGCGPTDQDAKSLGFTNVEEMKNIQNQGYKTKDSWNNHQFELQDLKFLKEHGFDSISDFKVFKALKLQDQLKTLNKNAIKNISYNRFIECAGTFEAAKQVFSTTLGRPITASEEAITGMYAGLRDEYISQGKSKEKIQNDLIGIYTKALSYNDNPSKFTNFSNECVANYSPFYTDKIFQYKLKSHE